MAITSVGVVGPRAERQKAPQEDPLDKVLKGLQIAQGVFGIYSGIKGEQRQEAAAEQTAMARNLAARQAEQEFRASQTNALNGQAAESQARAQKIALEARGVPVELETDRIKALNGMSDNTDKEFDRKMKIAKLALDEKALGLEVDKENTKRGAF